MSVQVTLTFASQEEAIAALGRIAGIAPAAAQPAAPAAEKTRKPRSDAGQPRGPQDKGKGEDAKGAGAGAPATATAGSAPAAAPAAPAPAAAAPEQPKAPAPTPDDVQKAVEKLFNAKGFEDCAAALSRFGVKRGKDLPEDQRAAFIRRVDDIAADKYKATDTWPELA